jgi:hypothetical protein
VVLHLPIGVAVVAALFAHALQADLVQHLLAVQLIQDNHPHSLEYSSLFRIQIGSGEISRIQWMGSMDPDPGPDPNLGLKIIGESHEHFCKK